MEKRWIEELIEKIEAQVAQVFILHFNIRDCFPNNVGVWMPLRDFLKEYFSDYSLLFYSVSSGITFGNDKKIEKDWLSFFDKDKIKQEEPFGSELVSDKLKKAAEKAYKESRESSMAADKYVGKSDLALSEINQYLQKRKKVLVIIDYAEKIALNGEMAALHSSDRICLELLQRFAHDLVARDNGNLVFLLTANLVEINSCLFSTGCGIEAIKIDLPDFEIRSACINTLIQVGEDDGRDFGLESGFTAKQFADLTGGLSCADINKLRLIADARGQKIGAELVRERKEEIIRAESFGLLEIMRSEFGFEAVGGMKHLREFFERIARAVKDKRSKDVPRGVLFPGSPGTGKTFVARALAHEIGFTFVKLGDVKEKWVGQSERNMSKALNLISALAPIIVFTDEIDQMVVGRHESGDSGVSSNIFGKILEFMTKEEVQGKVIWVAATNRPDLVDDALISRFDDRIPFFIPNKNEREEIFRVMQKICRVEYYKDVDFAKLASMTDNYTGREIEKIVRRASNFASVRSSDCVAQIDLVRAIGDYILSYSEEMYWYQTLLALRVCNSLAMLPEVKRGGVDYRVMATSNREKLEEDIHELRRSVLRH